MTQALVLAGAASRQSLVRWSQSRSKAAIRLFGRPVIEYVLEALLAAKEVSDVTVAGAPDLVSINFATRQKVNWAPSGPTMVQSLKQGLSVVEGDGPVLVVACDLPLLTPQAVDDFLRLARQTGGDVVYPLVPKRAVTTLGRGALKKYVRTREGSFLRGKHRPDLRNAKRTGSLPAREGPPLAQAPADLGIDFGLASVDAAFGPPDELCGP